MAGYGMSGRYAAVATDLEQYKCSICMEIYQNPIRISCGREHVFCEGCVAGLQPVNQQLQCPQCRSPFQKHDSMPANDIEIVMKSVYGHCKTCGTQMSVPELRQHMEVCGESEAVTTDLQFKPIRETSQPVPQPGPNRSTFQCPYCLLANMDCTAIIEHCNTQHRHDRTPVVCPICASMPWGDTNQVSINFLQHLNTRHKFEYETYVDYDQDDDAMLRAALEASMQQQ